MLRSSKRLLQSPRSGRKFFLLSAIACLYFLTVFFLAGYRSDFVLIGVAIEMLTLPMLAAIIIAATGSSLLLIRRQEKAYPLWTLAVSILTVFLLVWR